MDAFHIIHRLNTTAAITTTIITIHITIGLTISLCCCLVSLFIPQAKDPSIKVSGITAQQIYSNEKGKPHGQGGANRCPSLTTLTCVCVVFGFVVGTVTVLQGLNATTTNPAARPATNGK